MELMKFGLHAIDLINTSRHKPVFLCLYSFPYVVMEIQNMNM
jgi:hypothetical protein